MGPMVPLGVGAMSFSCDPGVHDLAWWMGLTVLSH